ncbi:hypothetical protein BGX29_002546, partial [Mortierella sp. GBA35]
MGVISLQCVTLNGTRLVGMSYTHPLNADDASADHVALVQSNPNPTSLESITWSLIAAWPREMTYPQDYSPMVCHTDPQTGVFTMMSAFNLTDPDYPGNPNVPQRPSGGFQYNPHTTSWTNFGLAPDYLWGDVTDSFTVFAWPGTTTLVQANVGTTTTVSLGVMKTNATGSPQFVNAVSWTLDPTTHGYPSRLVYGNNVLYQFGTLVANNRTGQLDTIMTRIPLSGNLETFAPPANLQRFNASSMSGCTPSYVSTSFYKDILYVFCQGIDTAIGPGQGIVMRFKDGPSGHDKALSPANQTDIGQLSGAAIQPIGGTDDGKHDPFAFVVNAQGQSMMQGIWLGEANLGEGQWVDYNINITAPYGEEWTNPPNHTPAIIGGSVAGGLLVLALIFYFVLRKRWPGWRRKLRVKIVEAMMEEDHKDNSSDRDAINKIEERSSSSIYNSFGLDGRDKILVTEDMEESGIDVSTGYMREVGLEQHPRPNIITTIGTEGENQGSAQHTADEITVATPISRTIGYASLLRSSPSTTPYTSDYELAVQPPRPLPPAAIIDSSHQHHNHYNHRNPTAPQLYTHADSPSSSTSTSPVPFRSTGSPPVPQSISSKEIEVWSHAQRLSDSATPYRRTEGADGGG